MSGTPHDESLHPRKGDGKFTVKVLDEATLGAGGVDLEAPGMAAGEPQRAVDVADRVAATDLRPGDTILLDSGARIVYENVLLEGPTDPVPAAFGTSRVSMVFRDISGNRVNEGADADQVYCRAAMCEDHRGAWGNDDYCPTCTTGDGRGRTGIPRPVPDHQPRRLSR